MPAAPGTARADVPRTTARGPVPKTAMRYLRTKGRRISDHWTDVWREEHATAFTVAQMAQDALLAEVHEALLQALRRGETLEAFRGRLQPWLERRGWAPTGMGGDVPTRLARIYRTNLRTARAAGQWDRISRNAGLLPYLVYELGPSEEHRREHVAWAGLCLRVDDPWWNTHYPPNGWGCKCRVRQVAAPPAGARTEAPPVTMRKWRNPRTGKVRKVALGIDPGWDYHVGGQRTVGVNAALLRRCERAVETRGPESAARMIERHLAGPGFQWFMERPRGRGRGREGKARWEARTDLIEATPVGLLPAEAMADMQAASPVVRLLEVVAHKQAAHHPEYSIDIYRRLPEILRAAKPREGRIQRQEVGKRWEFDHDVIVGGERRPVRVVIEVPKDGGRPLLISAHVIRLKTAAAD